jgi:hypothetical protein
VLFSIINAKMKDCCKDKRGKCIRNGKVFTLPVQYETLYARTTWFHDEGIMCAVCGVQEENEEERSTQNQENEEERSTQNQENQENQENISDF